jgi:glycosyltransferase involved in cell wall biosynthesis
LRRFGCASSRNGIFGVAKQAKDRTIMKILLVGEYSRLHNSLKEGLVALGHEVILIATGDYFKGYPADIKLKRRFDKGLGKKLKVTIYKLTGLDITSRSIRKQFLSHAAQLKGFDVVQLINESPLGAQPEDEKTIISFLQKHNGKMFLLSCGTDHLSVRYALGDALPYSILQGLKDGSVPASKYKFILKYNTPAYKALHQFILERVHGIIASDMDYHLPLKDHPKYLGLIPNPVAVDKLPYLPLSAKIPIVIFLGINRQNYHTKGIRYFEEALARLQESFPHRICIETVENLPYSEYIEKYNKAHIVLDQVFSFDQGYNALEAMAKGKVVFTGAEAAFTQHYSLTEAVAVNALPDVDYLVQQLTYFIEHPQEIATMGARARAFVSNKHDHLQVAQQYLNCWSNA